MISVTEFYWLLLICVGTTMMMVLMVLLLLRKLLIEVKEGTHKIATLIEQQKKASPAIVAGTRNLIPKTVRIARKKPRQTISYVYTAIQNYSHHL